MYELFWRIHQPEHARRNASNLPCLVLTAITDPVAAGLVNSLAHPGNHTTGTASLNEDVTPKLLEFIREILSKANTLAVLFNPSNSTNAPMMDNLQAKANPLGISVKRYALRSSVDLDPLFSMLTSKPPDALQLISDATINEFLGKRIADYAIANRLPSFSSNESSFENGVLLAYGASTRKILRRSSSTKAIDIEIPATLLARADRIIE